jgi:NPCBM/NEW2 domain-containing protein
VRSVLIVLLFANWINAAEVVATRLDGTTTRGELKSWDERQIVLETASGGEELALKDLISLRSSSTEPTANAPQFGQVELIDGTLIPIAGINSHGSRIDATLPQPGSGNDKVVLAKKLVAAVKLQPLSGVLAKQWQEIRDLGASADVLVLLKRDGGSLDYVEGIIGDVDEEKIEFELDGDSQRIDRSKVAGLIFYRRKPDSMPEPKFILHSASGLRANVIRARLKEGAMQFVTAAGIKLELPLPDVSLADFSAGKLAYLSDLEPAVQQWTPLVGLPAAAELAAHYGEPRRDQSAYGGALSLPGNAESPTASPSATQTFVKGLALRSRIELVYRLPGGFRMFSAIAGIDPAGRANGNVRLEIFGDDRPLLQSDVAGADSPKAIDLDITGVKRLKIIVDFGTNLDTGDWLNLCDARITK